jgi:glycosyltransferase involved in cell wall biosynthesis
VEAADRGPHRILGRRVPPDQVVNIMRSCDVVYYGLRPDFPNNRFSAPNALYSALEAGRPLLTTDVGEIARVVRDEGCGILLAAPTAEAVSAGLARLRVPQVREAMAENARRAAETRYNWAAAEAELLQLYRQLWGNV